jgi:hypothetical protein
MPGPRIGARLIASNWHEEPLRSRGMTKMAVSIGVSKQVLSFIICGDRPVTRILHSEHLQTDGQEMFEVAAG